MCTKQNTKKTPKAKSNTKREENKTKETPCTVK
jgi:hypothetical protein